MLQDLFTFVIENGLAQDTLLSLLILPALAALIVFFQIVVGLTDLSLIRGILLTLGMVSVGLSYGFFFFLVAFILDFLIRTLLEQQGMLRPAKNAFSLFFLALAFIVIFIFGGYFTKKGLLALDILPVLLILVTSQGMLQLNLGDHPLRPFIWLLGTSVFLYLAYSLVTSVKIQTIALTSPSLFLGIVFLIILFLARFRGLRLVEFFRFFKIIVKE